MTDSNLIKRSVVTKGGDDTNSPVPKQQIKYNGKVADSEMLFPYGMHANVAANVSLGVTWSIEGQEDYRVTMAYTPNERPRIDEGEVVFYHPLTLTKTHYRNNGDLDITVQGENGDLNLTIKKDFNITVLGNVNLTVTGDTTLKTNKFDVDSPKTNLGLGGPAIARVGDAVEVTITSGSSAGTFSGTITSGGGNNST